MEKRVCGEMCRYILFVGVCLLTILTLCMSNNPTKVAVAYCNEDGQFLSNDIVERNTNQFLEPITEDLPPEKRKSTHRVL